MSSLGLAKHRADQAIKHIDGPIGQTGGNVQTNGDQRCVSPAALVASDMLGGGAPGFARKLGEPRLMDQVATAWFDANLTDVFQTLDQTEHRRSGLAASGICCNQASQARTGRNSRRCVSASSPRRCSADRPSVSRRCTFRRATRRSSAQKRSMAAGEGTTIRRCRHVSIVSDQIGEPIIFDGLWRQATCQLSGGLFAEWTKPELALTLDGVTPAIPLCNEILVYREHDKVWGGGG